MIDPTNTKEATVAGHFQNSKYYFDYQKTFWNFPCVGKLIAQATTAVVRTNVETLP